MSGQKNYFQFTLGPVQSFVSQARRTRDFWAGSFILSWLSGVAIEAIRLQGGEVKFPVPDEKFMTALTSRIPDQQGTSVSQQGCIPNRFKAVSSAVPKTFNGHLVEEAVKFAWFSLAEIIWNNDLADIASPSCRAIWNRQVESFWEISWVISQEDNPSLIDQRKNTRTWMPSDEPGNKCMVMNGWQELSSIEKPDMQAVNSFWSNVRSPRPKMAQGMFTDIREGEQLCAIAFIKRRFARYFADVEGVFPGFSQASFHCWDVPVNVPSVSFIAAVPWLAHTIAHADLNRFREFYEAARTITDLDEIKTDIDCIRQAVFKRSGFDRRWAGLDGNIYFEDSLLNSNIYPDQDKASRVNKLRKMLIHRSDEPAIEEPSPFYAILLMDGDQLGKHMGEHKNQNPISNALNRFTSAVPDLVRKYDGFLVYAGGDDVLAILPMQNAMNCANALRLKYAACFREQASWIESTLSGAIEYVHIRTPLTRILSDAHNLLDAVAKEKIGRNALAIRVWKPGGLVIEWAAPWEKLVQIDQVILEKLADDFRQQDSAFTSKFFFRLERIIDRFRVDDLTHLSPLLLAEFLHSGGQIERNISPIEQRDLQEKFDALVDQCLCWQRKFPGDLEPELRGISVNAAMLVRFLAHKGLERE
ncbi:MAG: type III-B CRISPR-associated protein Cas10/Cmr2 [Pseudomonadales bacterium]|nr:type III-B CRISPR-associated protein Cas10/Cmr2 [Pseudomonadales bacterium]